MRYVIAPTDPCRDLILTKTDPNADGQTFELEHSGPDGTGIIFVNIRMASDSQFYCWGESEGANNVVDFPDNGGRRAALHCHLELKISP